VAAELGPGEERQAEIDRGGVEGIGGRLQFETQIRMSIKWSCYLNHTLSEIAVDAPIAFLVGVGQGGTFDGPTEAGVIKLATLRRQTNFDIA
jgi:hypothetical protein